MSLGQIKRDDVEVIKINGTKLLLIQKGSLSLHDGEYTLDGEKVDTKRDLIIEEGQSFKLLRINKNLIGYRRGSEVMSIKDFRSKKTWYNEDTSDENVLRAIANKKELEGFEPIEEDAKPEDVLLRVVGTVANTGSEFILSNVQERYSGNKVMYTVLAKEASMDEWEKLKNEHSKGHRFYNGQGQQCLRFAKIDGHYAFEDSFPFGDCGYSTKTTDLKKAKELEEKARRLTREAVFREIYPKKITAITLAKIKAKLVVIADVNKNKEVATAIDSLINDLILHEQNIKE